MSQGDDPDLFSRRAVILSSLGGLYFAVLGIRMAQLQIFENDEFRVEAAANQFNLVINPASRGPVYDRFGVPLAVNRRDFRVSVMRDDVKDLPTTIGALAAILHLSPEKAAASLREAKSAPRFMPAMVAENLSWEEFSRVSVYGASYPGVRCEMGEARNYPLAESMAHVLGYVARANDKDLLNDAQARHPGIRVGKEGIEKSQELGLRGAHGATKVEVNAHGRVIREVVDPRLAAKSGMPIVLTIDAEIQQIAYDQFQAKEKRPAEAGSAVVMDIRTGELLALVSAPAFDPNKFVDGINRADFAEYNAAEMRPLYHKAIRGIYPPGSTYKMVTAVAALEAKITDPEETINCPGYYMLGNHRFHCHSRGGHGRVNLHTAIKVSCDVYFYEMGRRIGGDKMAEVARGFGFGQRFDIGIPGVASSVVPDNAWKLKNRGQSWQDYDSLNVAIGQGLITATPLQLAVMAARIASQGSAVEPRLIREGPGAVPLTPFKPLPFNHENMHLVHEGMIAVSNEAGGTGRGDLGIPGVTMAGKTGTAQVRRISMAERRVGVRSNASLPWKQRDHALFVCYAPAEDPKYCCAVVVDHGGGGGATAAPRAREIMKATLLKDPSARPAFTTKAKTAELNPTPSTDPAKGGKA